MSISDWFLYYLFFAKLHEELAGVHIFTKIYVIKLFVGIPGLPCEHNSFLMGSRMLIHTIIPCVGQWLSQRSMNLAIRVQFPAMANISQAIS